MTAKETIEQTAAELGLTMTCEFVPWSSSRNKGEKSPSLNWRVTLHRKRGISDAVFGQCVQSVAFLTTDYSAGCGHCPGYKQTETEESRAVVLYECEHGLKGRFFATVDRAAAGMNHTPILPVLADVLSSLVMDAEVLDHGTFEEWADNLGYETDSRKAEATYRACLEIGLKLRNALGEDGLKRLRDACQDY